VAAGLLGVLTPLWRKLADRAALPCSLRHRLALPRAFARRALALAR